MKIFFGLLCISVSLSLINCGSAHKNIKSDWTYVNEYGEVRLIPKNDSDMRVITTNNEGFVFDTVFQIKKTTTLIRINDTLPFLALGGSGIEWHADYLRLHDFLNPAYMSMYTKIKNVYERPFYRTNKKITVAGHLTRVKPDVTLNGFHLNPNEPLTDDWVELQGTVGKEKYPLSYYSSDENEQAMFGDKNEVHYRLVMKDYQIKPIPKTLYTGHTANINGEAAFVSDLADSEAYYLYNAKAWAETELNKKIRINAVLVQFIDGKSVLKNWEILE